jgi:myo-inositol-1-phosphate synthase
MIRVGVVGVGNIASMLIQSIITTGIVGVLRG